MADVSTDEGGTEFLRIEGIFNDEVERIDFGESGTRMMSPRQSNGCQKRSG